MECETYLGILYDEILSTKTFSVDIYHQLNLSMRKMMESMFEDDELANLFTTSLRV